MSHFTVLVIGDDVERQLQPYHEYEYTGVDDEYVVDVDVTDTVVAEYNQPQKVVRLASGRVLSRWDDVLYVGSDRELQLPRGAEELEITADVARKHGIGPATLLQAAIEYYGDDATEQDGRFYNRTNPNAKWDWWLIGGRWTGFFKLKRGAKGVLGKPGAFDEKPAHGYADQVRKGDVDFEGMRVAAEIKATDTWNTAQRITNGASWLSWDDVQKAHPDDIDAARKAYHGQPAIAALKASKDNRFTWEVDENLKLPLVGYIKTQTDRVCVPYAVVYNGQWIAKGDMGWFGMSSDDTTQEDWNAKVTELLDSLPDDTLLTLVDCHI